MRRIFAILFSSLLLALSIMSLGTPDAKASAAQSASSSSQAAEAVNAPKELKRRCSPAKKCIGLAPADTFFAICKSYKDCANGDLKVAVSVGDSGCIGHSFSFTAAGSATVDFKPLSIMTCTTPGKHVKKVTYFSCYWYVTEQLPD